LPRTLKTLYSRPSCLAKNGHPGPDEHPMSKSKLTVYLAAPRGFCAGVDRAIQIVERALERYGAPVYVRHEIVHNRHVVEALEKKGAVFVEELDEIPGQFPVVFSAHGVPKAIPAEAERRELMYLDATCPLVSKVHREAEGHHAAGQHIILIGHAGHPEVIGTIGQLPEGAVSLVETADDAEKIAVKDPLALAYITQTTLSIDDTIGIISVLKRRFPNIHGPRKEDICYATTNRQQAVKAIAEKCDLMLVIGAPNSSNSRRLVEVALVAGCANAYLVQKAAEIDWAWFDGIGTVGITAGASAPEILVQEVIGAVRDRFDITTSEVSVTTETTHFKLPRALTA
jgi:4-hydroxy-3-methylbut-2-enyl diphosphate reductase